MTEKQIERSSFIWVYTIDVAVIMHKIHKKNNIICNKETSANIFTFGVTCKGKLIASKIGATLKGKNLLPEGANSFL